MSRRRTLDACVWTGAALLLQSPTLPADDGQHAFDAAIGEWHTHIERLLKPLTGSTQWVEYEGTHTIHKIWDGRANVGELRVEGPAGRIEAMSPRLYNPQSHQWSVSYANPRDGVLSRPFYGEFKNGRGEFYGQDTLDGKSILVREIYTTLTPASRHLEVAYSQDGGRTWETNWKMTDTRLDSGAAAAADASALLGRAVADPSRPAEDRAKDVQRKPQELLTFAEVKPGAVVVDLMPGTGYFTRLFSTIVGPAGKVYALQPAEMDKAAPKGLLSLRTFAGTSDYQNVRVLLQPVGALSLPTRVDLIWTSMNYHDLHDPFMGSPDMKQFNRSVLDALRPGGLFVVLDHAAADGTGFAKTDDLHRVDPAAVKAEVVAAGFEFVGESPSLRNSKDDHALPAFDPTVRGTTDRFIYKFRKPLR